jgi:glucosyl-dolichyl phosphate glucuronosyltransferase
MDRRSSRGGAAEAPPHATMPPVHHSHRDAAAPGGVVVPADVSVVICAYTEDRWDDLVAAVASVQSQTAAPMETIVVIDHNDELLARVRAEIAGVVAIANTEPQGLSGARNSGLAAAGGAVIAFLDDDAVAAPDWLERLTAPYADPRVMGVGGPAEAAWDAGRPRSFPAEFDWVVGCTYRGLPEETSPIRNMIGANMSLRAEVFEAVGGFRVGMGRIGKRPLGCEETEMCIRIQQHWPESVMVYEPAARVRHRVPPSRARWAYFRSRCYAEGLSKALVARFAGAGDGLSSERSYATRTLPLGVLRGIADALRGDLAGLARATLIVAGLLVTTAGYVFGATAGRSAVIEPTTET